jgi:uncharacterized protein
MSGGKMAIGGGIGTIIVVLIVLLLGGDPSQLLESGGAIQTEQVQPSEEEAQLGILDQGDSFNADL